MNYHHSQKKRQKEPAGSLSERFPQQRAFYHSLKYRLTKADRAKVNEGRALFFKGPALARAEAMCDALGSYEGFWYWLAPVDDPYLITDILIPEQRVSYCHCHVEASAVLKAARAARRGGCTIRSAGHSHGSGAVFSSQTDISMVNGLCDESCGFVTVAQRGHQGSVRKVEPRQKGEEVFEASFPSPFDRLRIRVACPRRLDIQASDLEVRLDQELKRTISLFSTSNRFRKHLMPVLETSACEACATVKTETKVDEVEVHIVGPIEIPGEEDAALRDKVDENVTRNSWAWGSQSKDRASESPTRTDVKEEALAPQQQALPAPTAANRPLSFEVRQGGRNVATIKPAVLEEAAARSPNLAKALGWESSSDPVEKDANDDRVEQ